MQRRFGVAPAAQDHEVIGIGDKASTETMLKASGKKGVPQGGVSIPRTQKVTFIAHRQFAV
jgi:hypothetical protein